VLISVTRTERLGFLQSQNRVNVMLTRCKSGMVIVTNRAFLRTAAAQSTLLGKLARYWETQRGQARTWTDWNLVAEKNADMPGAPGIRPSLSLAPIIATARPEPTASLKPPPYVLSHCSRIDDEPLENIFPSLGITGATKPTAQSRWNNSSGLAAVKHARGASNSLGHESGNRRAEGSLAIAAPHMVSQDPFPSLPMGKNIANSRGQWNRGPESRR